MTYPELEKALYRLKVETGSLACMGCGYEHNCSIHGCAILREAEQMASIMSERFNENTLLATAAQVLDTTVDRLREAAKADRDGRLVVLPCRMGETVFAIKRGRIMECVAYTAGMSVLVNGTITLLSKEEALGIYGVRFDKFGETAFLTREEAEKALKEAKGDG